jgi:hypothetical protein
MTSSIIPDGRIVLTFVSADGKHRIFITEREDNRASYEVEIYVMAFGHAHWSSAWSSGLYENAVAAERAARLEIPWLREQTSD